MAKNCKIIAVYFGVRRTYPHTYIDTIKILKDSIKNEIELDPGVDNLDTIFVNHDCGIKKANDFLDSFDGVTTFAGRIRVLHRPWGNGAGMSPGSIDYGFKKLKDDYDYWFFQEDDYKVVKKDYYKKGVEILDSREDVAFIGYDMYHIKSSTGQGYKLLKWIFQLPILIWGYKNLIKKHNKVIDSAYTLRKSNEVPYCGGIMGLTHKKYINQIIELNGKLPYPDIPNPRYKNKFKQFNKNIVWGTIKTFFIYNQYITWYWLHIILAEINFTRIYYDIGYRIISYPEDNKLIYSYKKGGYKERLINN